LAEENVNGRWIESKRTIGYHAVRRKDVARLKRICMKATCAPNPYDRELTDAEIEAGEHRQFIGGLWEDVGRLQFEYLRQRGLRPHHRLLDVGCGALRGGIHFARYLEEAHYYGLDLNASLIDAGRRELRLAGLDHKRANLAVSDTFDFAQFGCPFDFALAQSVFTHLPFNPIIRCLVEMRKVLKRGGEFHATFFEAPGPAQLADVIHPAGVKTHYDRDPFHQSWDEVRWMAKLAGLRVQRIGEWDHPRNQRMLMFYL
jgi:SAM-dependent methyltransferase